MNPPENDPWLASLARQRSESESNWWTAFLLSLFLGWLGADRFYLGGVATGMLKLCTFGLFGLWWLFDLVLLCLNQMKDADGGIVRRPF